MLDLASVTLCCIDTANPVLALRAIERSRTEVRFARTLFVTTSATGAAVPADIDVVAIEPLASRDAYSQFVLKSLLPHVDTAHVLLIQWDGYIVNPGAWDDSFLDCDYIGAKWFWHTDGMRVGNGGFSLRSRRLLEALQDPRIELVEAEDLTIGRTFRPLLEREYAIRFASEATADRFAFEAAYPIGRPFGFHGLFNFCRVVPPAELTALATQFSDTIARSPQIVALAKNCIALGQWQAAIALARRMLAASAEHAEARTLLAVAERNATKPAAVGRNDPCPCGSGRKYKHCHGALGASTTAASAAATNATTPSVAPTPATAMAPRSADALARDAMGAHQRGDLDLAERGYREALALAPSHPVATHYLGVIMMQRQRLDEALPLLERAAREVPHEPEFHNNLGLALAAADRPTEAIEAFRRALALKPTHAIASNNLGLALQALNRLPDAIAAFRAALAQAPEFTQARWNLALALLASGDFAEGWPAYDTRLALRELGASAPRDAGAALGAASRGATQRCCSQPSRGSAMRSSSRASHRLSPTAACGCCCAHRNRWCACSHRFTASTARSARTIPHRHTTRGCRCCRWPVRWVSARHRFRATYRICTPIAIAARAPHVWSLRGRAVCASASHGQATESTSTIAAARCRSPRSPRCSTCPPSRGSRCRKATLRTTSQRSPRQRR